MYQLILGIFPSSKNKNIILSQLLLENIFMLPINALDTLSVFVLYVLSVGDHLYNSSYIIANTFTNSPLI